MTTARQSLEQVPIEGHGLTYHGARTAPSIFQPENEDYRLSRRYRTYGGFYRALSRLEAVTFFRKHPMVVLRNLLNRAAYRTVLTDGDTVVVRTNHGFAVAIPLNDQAAADLLFLGSYGTSHVDVMRALLGDCAGFLDVGANLGFFSLLAATGLEKQPIWAIEPNPELCNLIALSSRINSFDNIRIINAAIGSQSGYGRLEVDPTRSSHAVVARTTSDTGAALVPIMTLRDAVRLDKVRSRLLVKVDVEGSEVDVLRGSSELFHHRSTFLCELSQSVDNLHFLARDFSYTILTYEGRRARRSRAEREVILVPSEREAHVQDMLARVAMGRRA